MSEIMNNNHINYIEFKSTDIQATKKFYSTVFGWKFTDYGDHYVSFDESGISGGFERTMAPIVNGVLIVLFHSQLENIKTKVIQEGGQITKDIFSFPGGKRFQFIDHSGNELAVWSHE
ncbi:MAG: VOC family protein [Bacteroidetes bacterium]|nr:VOC family protein [Bacteroidota bacterium]